MRVDFSTITPHENPTLILRNASGSPLGVIAYATKVAPRLMYNEVSVLTFDVPAFVNGKKTPLYDELVGMRIVDLHGVGQFILVNPVETKEMPCKKSCTAYSLEYEFSYKKISITTGTFRFYNPDNPTDTIMQMIMENMPSWTVGSVAPKIAARYRTFEVNNENLYNFIKNTVQKSYNCIFDFDTYNRVVHVRDADEDPEDRAVYLSTDNLATQLEISEDTENVFTRLDVNGAEGITIRDVNPTGTNKLINLDYYMTPENFSEELIQKYYSWKELVESYRKPFYSKTVQYFMAVAKRVAKEAELTDLEGDLASIDNQRVVAIQALQQSLNLPGDVTSLPELYDQYDEKSKEISEQYGTIEAIQAQIDGLMADLVSIRDICKFENNFTTEEQIALDRYIKDGDVTESTFAAVTTNSYGENGNGGAIPGAVITIRGADELTSVDYTGLSSDEVLQGVTVYDIRGGTLTLGTGTKNEISAEIISATIDYDTDDANEFTASFFLGNVNFVHQDGNTTYVTGCLTINGSYESCSCNEAAGSVDVKLSSGYRYLTVDATEYEKHNIAWDLFEYGEAVLSKVSRPTMTFSVQCANFLVHEDFVTFKNSLKMGERVYIDGGYDMPLRPICIGVQWEYDTPDSLELMFSDRYTAGDPAFSLADILDQSISMGKTLDMSKYVYSNFEDSGAINSIEQFMTSALDAAKNAVLTSTNMAISWDGSGLHLRKYEDDRQAEFSKKQIWMINNSIVMTKDGWKTAEMAIGEFYDERSGQQLWGIVAPMIVGRMIAGTSLIIESSTYSGNTSVFTLDGNGCKLYNADFEIVKGNGQIILSGDEGITIGPVGSDDPNLTMDTEGNITMRGALTATQLYIMDMDAVTINGGVDDTDKTMAAYIKEHSTSNVFNQKAMPLTGFKSGDLWFSNDEFGSVYVATGTPEGGNTWVLVSSQGLNGAALTVNPESGEIKVLAENNIDIASNNTLNIAGAGSLNLASLGGITIAGTTISLNTHNNKAGEIYLGSSANKLTSSGVLSLADGNILLDGPNNTAVIGNGGGMVNIATEGNGTVNVGNDGGTVNVGTKGNGIVNVGGESGTVNVGTSGQGVINVGNGVGTINVGAEGEGVINIGNSGGTINVGAEGDGTVNIGTSGSGTINLANYQIQSMSSSASYTCSTVGISGTDKTSSITILYDSTGLDPDVTTTSGSMSIAVGYTEIGGQTRSLPSVSGMLLEATYDNVGVQLYTSSNSVAFVPTSTDNGHLLGWNTIGCVNLDAGIVTSTSVYADNMYVGNYAVANQKWTIDTIVDILSNSIDIATIREYAENAKWMAYKHTHYLNVNSVTGEVTVGDANYGEPGNFSVADTTFYQTNKENWEKTISAYQNGDLTLLTTGQSSDYYGERVLIVSAALYAQDDINGPPLTTWTNLWLNVEDYYREWWKEGYELGKEEAGGDLSEVLTNERITCQNNLAITTYGSWSDFDDNHISTYVGGYIGFTAVDGKLYQKALTGLTVDATNEFNAGQAEGAYNERNYCYGTMAFSEGSWSEFDSSHKALYTGASVSFTGSDGVQYAYSIEDIESDASTQYSSGYTTGHGYGVLDGKAAERSACSKGLFVNTSGGSWMHTGNNVYQLTSCVYGFTDSNGASHTKTLGGISHDVTSIVNSAKESGRDEGWDEGYVEGYNAAIDAMGNGITAYTSDDIISGEFYNSSGAREGYGLLLIGGEAQILYYKPSKISSTTD